MEAAFVVHRVIFATYGTLWTLANSTIKPHLFSWFSSCNVREKNLLTPTLSIQWLTRKSNFSQRKMSSQKFRQPTSSCILALIPAYAPPTLHCPIQVSLTQTPCGACPLFSGLLCATPRSSHDYLVHLALTQHGGLTSGCSLGLNLITWCHQASRLLVTSVCSSQWSTAVITSSCTSCHRRGSKVALQTRDSSSTTTTWTSSLATLIAPQISQGS